MKDADLVGALPQLVLSLMAARIYTEKQIYMSDEPARRFAIKQAVLLWNEVSAQLEASK